MPLSDRTRNQIIEMIQKEMAGEIAEAERRGRALKELPEAQGWGFYIKIPYIKTPYIKIPYVKLPG